MITALAARWLLTAVFVAAGLRAAIPGRRVAGSARPADRFPAVACVAMCAALIAEWKAVEGTPPPIWMRRHDEYQDATASSQ